MQRQRLGVIQALVKVIRYHVGRNVLLTDCVAERIVVPLGQCVRQFLRPTAVAALVHADELPLLQIAVDSMFLDTGANLFLGRLGKIP